VLAAVRNVVAQDMYVRLDAPSMVSLFVYDNDKFIVESFQENPVQARILTDARITKTARPGHGGENRRPAAGRARARSSRRPRRTRRPSRGNGI
jgi:hypothetical protein